MKLIVCLDDQNGMLFNHRRQSTDRVLRQRVLALTGDTPLWMNAYSANQFSEEAANMIIDEKFLSKAAEHEYCFAESGEILNYADRVSQLIIYRWNRVYPSDTKLPDILLNKNWKLVEKTDFKGYSHEKITEEIYSL